MKVAFISTLYAPNEIGGAERTVRTLAEHLVKRGHEAVVISLSPTGKFATGIINGVDVYYVPLRNLFWWHSGEHKDTWLRALWHCIDAYNPLMRRVLTRILRDEQPDVVQTGNLQGFSVSAWLAAHHLKIPIVQMLHDYYLACPNSAMFRAGANCSTQCRSCRLCGMPRRLLSNLPVAVISLSSRVLHRMERCDLFVDVDHKIIIHGANDTMPPTVALRTNKSPGEAITVGYLGRLERTKGIEVLLNAARRIGPDKITVLIAGTGHEHYSRELNVNYANGSIQFLGLVTPAEMFAKIDLLVVPSLWEEPLGRVIYEAYGHGVPSAVSRVGGMPEIVDEGESGWVFDAGDDQQLAAILEHEIDSGWRGEQYSRACLRKSREFDIEHLFARYFGVWETAARARPDLRLRSVASYLRSVF